MCTMLFINTDVIVSLQEIMEIMFGVKNKECCQEYGFVYGVCQSRRALDVRAVVLVPGTGVKVTLAPNMLDIYP